MRGERGSDATLMEIIRGKLFEGLRPGENFTKACQGKVETSRDSFPGDSWSAKRGREMFVTTGVWPNQLTDWSQMRKQTDREAAWSDENSLDQWELGSRRKKGRVW